ncbi:hypothetical protein [Streptomyces graminilatus]|uniref:hypothetical protein n=1 Tax=Streptomyces graminilatus TaxID=1464070 RepID=UPI000AA6E50A|nr:hypothetical protein [Streptomyces graminilatus]
MRARQFLRAAVGATAGALAGALLSVVVAPGADAAPATAPATGTATARAAATAGSAVTVSGRGEFAAMRFTVSQTEGLTDRAVTVSWTGGTPTTFAGNQFNTDFVQIMQCWGEDDGTHPDNPGPPRTQCEYGASPTTDRSNWPGNGDNDTRAVVYRARPGHYGQDDTYGSGMPFGLGEVPFKSVDGTVVTSGTQNNRFFNHTTTNEIDFARTGAAGTGSEIFETQTLNEAPQLGCGAPVTHADGTVTGRSCWLVIVPQGHLDLDGEPYEDQTQVNAGSPVSSTNWKNRVAVRLGFNPVGASCKIGAEQQDTMGSELVAEAMSSWQARLCADGTVYGFTQLGDADTRARVTSGAGALGFVTRPLGSDDGTTRPTDTVLYAPVALSGVVIGFNIERQPGSTATSEQKALEGTRFASMRLTPRLIAKLLTESYRGSPWGAVRTTYSDGTATQTAAKGYGWVLNNPAGLLSDPEFLALNPEYANQSLPENPSTDTDLQVALGHTDAARQLWNYVLADKDARRFLAGVPDDNGMRVNPYYSTNDDLNPTGYAFTAARDDFPKADPWTTLPPGSAEATVKQGMTDFHPYVDDMLFAALHARRGDQLWKSSWDATANPPVWKSPGPQNVGQRVQLVVTDSASAARYGLQTAGLLNSGGRYVTPTPASLSAAAASATGSPAVVPVTSSRAGAYPLAMLVDAVVRPGRIEAADRRSYAALLRYAVQAGQHPGITLGDLPLGYAPLDRTLRGKALTAAKQLESYRGAAATGGSTAPATGGGTGGTTGGAAPEAGGGTSGTDTGAGAGGGTGAGTPTGSASSPTPSGHPVPRRGGTAPDLIVTAGGLTPADPAVPFRLALPIGAGLGALTGLIAPFAAGWRPRIPAAARFAVPALVRRTTRRPGGRFRR